MTYLAHRARLGRAKAIAFINQRDVAAATPRPPRLACLTGPAFGRRVPGAASMSFLGEVAS